MYSNSKENELAAKGESNYLLKYIERKGLSDDIEVLFLPPTFESFATEVLTEYSKEDFAQWYSNSPLVALGNDRFVWGNALFRAPGMLPEKIGSFDDLTDYLYFFNKAEKCHYCLVTSSGSLHKFSAETKKMARYKLNSDAIQSALVKGRDTPATPKTAEHKPLTDDHKSLIFANSTFCILSVKSPYEKGKRAKDHFLLRYEYETANVKVLGQYELSPSLVRSWDTKPERVQLLISREARHWHAPQKSIQLQ
ncbi:MAG: hypothetical protein U5N86_00505 [Planctomycetota bacterium]|nr:hypothetical protein [Planctomycetota bacterium]